MQLTANVYVETGYNGANVGYVMTDNGIVMIESPQGPTDALAWKKQIEAKGQIKCLINTEGHGDHITGDFFFQVPVVCHEKARESILATDINRIKEMVGRMDPEGAKLLENFQVKAPTITYSERLTLYFGSHTFQLINTPGHTAGQTSVFIPEEKVVFTGDNVNYKSPAFLHEAVPYEWLKSLKIIGELDADYIVPGHGEVCDRSYLPEWAEFIQEWIDAVKQAKEKGWSKEETIEKISPPSRYSMGPDGDEFARMLVTMNVTRLYDVV